MKKIMTKKVIPFILAGLMMFSIFPAGAMAEESQTDAPVVLTVTDYVKVKDNEEVQNSAETVWVENSSVVVNGDIDVEGYAMQHPDGTVTYSLINGVEVIKSDIEVNGNIYCFSGTGVNAGVNSNVVVNGDIQSEHVGTGASICTGSHAEINGDVRVNGESGTGIDAFEQSTVFVYGDVMLEGYGYALDATYGSAITAGTDEDPVQIQGDVLSAIDSEVTIYGDVNTVNRGIDVDMNSKATVNGNVSGETGANVGYDCELVVNGDLEGNKGGLIAAARMENDTTVIVDGTVRGCEESSAYYILPVDLQADLEMPEVIVYKLETESDDVPLVDVTIPWLKTMDELDEAEMKEASEKIVEAAAAAIQYIVYRGEGAIVDGTSKSTAGDYDIAREGDVLIVSAKGEIENVSAGDYAEVSRNADGTYTVLVRRGGDLTIRVTLKEMETVKQVMTQDETFEYEYTLNGSNWRTLRKTQNMLRLAFAEVGNEEPEEMVQQILGEDLYECVTKIGTLERADALYFFGDTQPHVYIEIDLNRVNINGMMISAI